YLKSNAPEWLARVTVREGSRLRHRFWQPGGGYDRNITSTEALRAAIDYIHANPVRCGLVARAQRLGMVQRALVRGTATDGAHGCRDAVWHTGRVLCGAKAQRILTCAMRKQIRWIIGG